MSKRQGISASLRWSIFARDGYTCRYCGSQAGQDGVTLAVDHVVSVAEGGDNRVDNLVTACQRCNGGKGAKSLSAVPATEEVAKRTAANRASVEAVAADVRATIEAEKQLKQDVVNLKCSAYQTDSVRLADNEETGASRLIREFGAEKVLGWYKSAAKNGVREYDTMKYLYGCARKTRETAAQQGDAAEKFERDRIDRKSAPVDIANGVLPHVVTAYGCIISCNGLVGPLIDAQIARLTAYEPIDWLRGLDVALIPYIRGLYTWSDFIDAMERDPEAENVFHSLIDRIDDEADSDPARIYQMFYSALALVCEDVNTRGPEVADKIMDIIKSRRAANAGGAQ